MISFFEQALEVYSRPFNDLLFEAQGVHRKNFNASEIQISSLLSIKTGGCPEDCAYCPQSAHYKTGVKSSPLMNMDDVLVAARQAKLEGATRFCMGAAWKNPKDGDLDLIGEMISQVKSLGLETCATLGTLSLKQAQELKDFGLDFYNHNLDTSPEFYKTIVTTRQFSERVSTLTVVSNVGMKVCSGGIVGMGESVEDRLRMLEALNDLPTPPESIPLNFLIPIQGTPLAGTPQLDPFAFVRLVATTRILFPKSYIRIAAGRENLSDEFHALSFLAGANSIFLGERLLTAANPSPDRDSKLLCRLGINGINLPKSYSGLES